MNKSYWLFITVQILQFAIELPIIARLSSTRIVDLLSCHSWKYGRQIARNFGILPSSTSVYFWNIYNISWLVSVLLWEEKGIDFCIVLFLVDRVILSAFSSFSSDEMLMVLWFQVKKDAFVLSLASLLSFFIVSGMDVSASCTCPLFSLHITCKYFLFFKDLFLTRHRYCKTALSLFQWFYSVT